MGILFKYLPVSLPKRYCEFLFPQYIMLKNMGRITDNQDFTPSNGEVVLYNPDDTIRLKMPETKEGEEVGESLGES